MVAASSGQMKQGIFKMAYIVQILETIVSKNEICIN